MLIRCLHTTDVFQIKRSLADILETYLLSGTRHSEWGWNERSWLFTLTYTLRLNWCVDFSGWALLWLHSLWCVERGTRCKVELTH